MAIKNAKTAESAAVENQNQEENLPKPVEEPVLRLVYVGPALPGGELKTNAILIGRRSEIQKELKQVLEKIPQVLDLLVPLNQLAEAKKKLKKGNRNALKETYLRVEAAAKESKKEG